MPENSQSVVTGDYVTTTTIQSAQTTAALANERRTTTVESIAYVEPPTPKLAAALANAQKDYQPLSLSESVTVRMKSGGSYTFKYAPLASILAATRQALANNELALQWRVLADGVVVSLLHSSGESQHSRTWLVWPRDPKEKGSLITYNTRYAVCGILGIVGDGDIDAPPAPGDQVNVAGNQYGISFDPADSRIQSAEQVEWLARSTKMDPRDIGKKLGITRWSEYPGTVLEAYNAVMGSKAGLSDEQIAELKSRIGGDIPDDLLASFLGVETAKDYTGTVEEAYKLVQEQSHKTSEGAPPAPAPEVDMMAIPD